MFPGRLAAGPGPRSLDEPGGQAARALARYDEAVAEAGGGKDVTVTPPSWDPVAGAPGMAIDSAWVTPAGTRLTVTFTGAIRSAAEPCGADYSAEAVESAHAVVVVLVEQRHAYGGVCPSAGLLRTATGYLVRPLDGRAVPEVREGQPVPVSTGGQ